MIKEQIIQCPEAGENRCKAKGTVILVVPNNKECISDETFGFDGTYIWVKGGCKGSFTVSYIGNIRTKLNKYD